MTPSSYDVFLAAARQDLKLFLALTYKELHPNSDFLDNWHIDAIVNCLELSIKGKMPRLMINLPPRNLKSIIVSVALPAFLLGLNPTTRIICVSYGAELALDLARKTRRILGSPWYQKMFPNTNLLKTAESDLETQQGGMRYATTVGGALTGKGADFIIVDDPTKAGNVGTFSGTSSANEWYRNTLLSRLDDKMHGVLIVVMQRLHVLDLAGFIGEKDGFHTLSLPAIATKNETIALRHGETHTRRVGDVLHPERESLEILNGLKAQMGPFLFAAQYQQSPQTPDGDYFKLKYLPRVTDMPQDTGDGYWCLSVDCAAAQTENADYTAMTLAFVCDGVVTVVDARRGTWDYERIKAIVLREHRKRGDNLQIIVENASVGISLLTFLKSQGIRCMPYKPLDSKQGRAAAVLPIFEAGRVRFLQQNTEVDCLQPLIDELVSFDHGRYDDWVDCMVQLAWYANRFPYPFGRVTLC